MGTGQENTVRNEQGFTLLELIVVVAVLGILMAIAIQQFSLYRSRARRGDALRSQKCGAGNGKLLRRIS